MFIQPATSPNTSPTSSVPKTDLAISLPSAPAGNNKVSNHSSVKYFLESLCALANQFCKKFLPSSVFIAPSGSLGNLASQASDSFSPTGSVTGEKIAPSISTTLPVGFNKVEGKSVII